MKIFLFGRTEPIGRDAYLLHLLACALLFGGFVALDLRLSKGFVEFIIFMIAFFVYMEWTECLKSRLQDAGLSRRFIILLLTLIVPMVIVLCLLLVVFKVIAWPYALILYVLTQIPVGFLRQKSKPV